MQTQTHTQTHTRSKFFHAISHPIIPFTETKSTHLSSRASSISCIHALHPVISLSLSLPVSVSLCLCLLRLDSNLRPSFYCAIGVVFANRDAVDIVPRPTPVARFELGLSPSVRRRLRFG